MGSASDDRLTMIGVYHLRRPIRFPASLSQGSFRVATRHGSRTSGSGQSLPLNEYSSISELSAIPTFGGRFYVRACKERRRKIAAKRLLVFGLHFSQIKSPDSAGQIPGAVLILHGGASFSQDSVVAVSGGVPGE